MNIRNIFFQVAAVAGLSFVAPSVQALDVGDYAPCVVLAQQLADGTATEGCIRDVTDEENHSFTILDFASIFCSTCKANQPFLFDLTERVEETATVRKIYVDRSKSRVEDYVEDNKDVINYSVAFDTDRDARRAYEVRSTPTLFILDEENTIVYKHRGPMDDETVEEIVELVGGE